ncbi:hypothetical protein C1637_18645 [Chryseobacterium lactis]|uniref:Bacteriocin n=1 Tax=Chryseobacterium lactis TaxID=1241981 RepID=A0A3G6RUJ9_CHRLC|nr:hypothetical protein EG342_24155 [Chryseobacterium lactis]AZB05190.1 hypothetical protein EG341_15035 [Chryseobacterium lactis]PNW12172.1 hypothetical protein C1637_18645 [Chryseobacterium lactis]
MKHFVNIPCKESVKKSKELYTSKTMILNILLLKLIKMKNSKLQNLLTKISADVTTLKEGELSSIKGGTAPLNLVCNSGCLAKA